MNFWVFPMYIERGFLGALRVVNRVDERDTVVPWPFLVRRRIAGLLPSVSLFLEGCEHPAAGTAEVSVARPRLLEFTERRLDRRRRAVGGLIVREAPHMDSPSIEQLLDALAELSEIRIESRWLGLTAIVVSADRIAGIRDLITQSIYTPQHSLPSLTDLDAWSRQAPATVLAVTSDGTLLGSLRITSSSAATTSSLSTQHGIDLVLVQSPGIERLIEIWRDGEHVADYASLPRLGAWSLREFGRARDAIASKMKRGGPLVDTILRRAVSLSYHHGSMIVLLATTDTPGTGFPMSDPGERPDPANGGQSKALELMSPGEFIGLASVDGAAIVTVRGSVESYKETLPTAEPAGLTSSDRKAMNDTRALLNASSRGKRHESGMMASLHFRDSAVFCASQNRTVCVFVRGEAVVWDF